VGPTPLEAGRVHRRVYSGRVTLFQAVFASFSIFFGFSGGAAPRPLYALLLFGCHPHLVPWSCQSSSSVDRRYRCVHNVYLRSISTEVDKPEFKNGNEQLCRCAVHATRVPQKGELGSDSSIASEECCLDCTWGKLLWSRNRSGRSRRSRVALGR